MIISRLYNPVLSTLMIGAFIILSACSTSSEKIPDIPEFPNFSAASTIDEHFAVTSARSGADTTQTTFIKALDQLDIILRELTISTTMPTAIFQQATEITPDFKNGSYEWVIDQDFQDFSISFSYIITTNVISDQISEWSISIHFDSDFTSDFGFPSLESFDILRGNYDGNPFKGKWEVLSGNGTSLPDRQIDIQSSLTATPYPELSVLTWDITSDSVKEFQMQGATLIAEYSFYFSLNENVWKAEYETESDVITIEWNRNSGEGFIEIGAEKHCWDSSNQNTNC